jgi:hypothetical protein
MKRFSRTLLITTLGLTILVLGQGAALAQTTMDVDYSWTAPTSGSPVDHYIVEHSVDGGVWTQIASASSNSYTLVATVGVSHRIRVAGVDAEGRQGPYSVSSDPYTPDPGPPGQPGKPILF